METNVSKISGHVMTQLDELVTEYNLANEHFMQLTELSQKYAADGYLVISQTYAEQAIEMISAKHKAAEKIQDLFIGQEVLL